MKTQSLSPPGRERSSLPPSPRTLGLEITINTQESGEPGPFHGQKRTSCLKLPRLHRKLISNPSMDQLAHIKQIGPDDVAAKEKESRGEKVREVGMGMEIKV